MFDYKHTRLVLLHLIKGDRQRWNSTKVQKYDKEVLTKKEKRNQEDQIQRKRI